MDLFGAQRLDSPAITAPAFMPATFSNDDPLGPLILRTGFSMSYAPTNTFSRAHDAAAELSRHGKDDVRVQIGTYGERANAERIASLLGGYGSVAVAEVPTADRMLYSVGVIVDRSSMAPESVLAAAHAAGIADAFIVSR